MDSLFIYSFFVFAIMDYSKYMNPHKK